MNPQTVFLVLPGPLHAEAAELARRRGSTLPDLIVSALSELLEEQRELTGQSAFQFSAAPADADSGKAHERA